MAAIPIRFQTSNVADTVSQALAPSFEKIFAKVGKRMRKFRRDFSKDAFPAMRSMRKDFTRQAKPMIKSFKRAFVKKAAPTLRMGIGKVAIQALRMMDRIQNRAFRRRRRMVKSIRAWMA